MSEREEKKKRSRKRVCEREEEIERLKKSKIERYRNREIESD